MCCRIFLFLALMCAAAGSNAYEIGDLQGSWLITQVGDLKNADIDEVEDIWKFEGNYLTVSSGNFAFDKDFVTVAEDVISFPGLKIKIIALDENRMKLNVMGMLYSLTKID